MCVVRGNPMAFPSLNENLVCVDFPVVFFFCFCFLGGGWLRWLLPGYTRVLKVLYHGNANLPSLRIPLQILKRASLARLRPVVYLSSAFYTQSKPRLPFQ